MKSNGNHRMFKAYGASVTGSKNRGVNKVNQDAFGWSDESEGLEVIVLSDGHGGPDHDLSELGAKFAVEAALTCAKGLATDEPFMSIETAEALYWFFEEPFSQKIQTTWKSLVRLHSDKNDIRRYGCTLLMAIHWKAWLIFLQIGDGKIAFIYNDGRFDFPMSPDSRLMGNLTFSMSQPCAWAEMKVQVMPFDSDIHTVVLASDGVENAYPNGKYDDIDFYLWIASESPCEASLEEGLKRAEHYSKDDSTAVVWRSLSEDLSFTMPTDVAILLGIEAVETAHIERETMARICEGPLNKRVEMAIHLVNQIEKSKAHFSALNTLKSIFIESDGSGFSWRDNAPVKYEIDRIIALINLLSIRLEGDKIRDCGSLKKALVMYQRKLRYSYVDHRFCTDEDTSTSGLEMIGAFGPFELFSDSTIYLHQLMPLSGTFDPVIGEVVQHSKHRGIWGLKNKSNHSWQIGERSIAPNDILTIKDGIVVWIYGLPITIRFRNLRVETHTFDQKL